MARKSGHRAAPDSILIGIAEAAAMADLHPQTVRKLVAAGRFPPPRKLGHAHRWVRAEVAQFLTGSAS